MAKEMRPGGGGRFEALTKKLEAKGSRSPRALAAWIGRRKYGGRQMAKWSAEGRRRAS